MPPTFERCPYTLKRLADIATSTEHIFPYAIGGDGRFSVKVDRKENSSFGCGLDARFVDSHLVRALRAKLGISSRSGESTWEVRGKTRRSGRPVAVTLGGARKVALRYLKPVTVNPLTEEKVVFGTSEQTARISAEICASMKAKGYSSISMSGSNVPREPLDLDFSENIDGIRQGLIKIAFLSAFSYLGDEWLSDPMYAEWRLALSDDLNLARLTRVPGMIFRGHRMFKTTSPHEHAVAIFHMPKYGIQVALRLFGNDMLSAVFAVSLSDYGRQPLEGVMTICNAKSRKAVTGSFLSMRS